MWRSMIATRRIAMPGPELQPRIIAVPTRVRERRFSLPPGSNLLDAISKELGDCKGAVLHLGGGAFGPFHYVIPALSATPDYAAFYSDVRTPKGATSLDAARVTYGSRDGKPWLHCHGFWTDSSGKPGGGHVIPDHTIIAEAMSAEVWLLDGAAFVTSHDAETNFTLLAPEPTAANGDSLAIRLRPNQDLCTTLEQLCATHGIAHAAIRGGVASIIGAVFDDGRVAEPFATEIFIRSGEIAPGANGEMAAGIDIGLVNYLGELFEGRLRRGANPVLMTAELLLQPLG
jgi:predicted DNA-binding protein with PD1-like motif